MTNENVSELDYQVRLEKLINPAPVGPVKENPVTRLKKIFFRRVAEPKTNPVELPPYKLFSDVDDDFWYWLNTEGYRQNPVLQKILPGMPDPVLQSSFVGANGDDTLRIGINVYRLVKQLYEKYVGELTSDKIILDYGCGWGRVIRFFLKDIEPTKLVGIDCIEEVIKVCKDTDKWCNFETVNPQAPTNLPANSFDLIFAISVFSHISEENHLGWLKEFQRLLKPGGLLVITTRTRQNLEFISNPANRATLHPSAAKAGNLVKDLDTWVAKYDEGQYCHAPVGGGYSLDKSFFGETWIPKGYVLSHWTKYFTFLEFFEDANYFDQNIIVVKKP